MTTRAKVKETSSAGCVTYTGKIVKEEMKEKNLIVIIVVALVSLKEIVDNSRQTKVVG